MPDSSQPSSQPPSPIPSPLLFNNTPPLLHEDTDLPPGFDFDPGTTNTPEDAPLGFDVPVSDHQVPDTSPITCAYHPKLDGKSIFSNYVRILTVTCRVDL